MSQSSQSIKLTDDELIALAQQADVSWPASITAAIATAQERRRLQQEGLSPAESTLITQAIKEARTSLKLVWYHVMIRHCPICDADGGYAPYKSAGGGHKKGDPNYKRPRYLNAVANRGKARAL